MMLNDEPEIMSENDTMLAEIEALTNHSTTYYGVGQQNNTLCDNIVSPGIAIMLTLVTTLWMCTVLSV